MFYPIEGGSVYEIKDNSFGFVYRCHLPPVGYGVNSITGKVEKTDVIRRSDIPEMNMWERYELPKDWKEKVKAEKEKRELLKDKDYFDPYLENIRIREWNRRLCGVWFWNYNTMTKKEELIYITGTHYLYCTYWVFQGKHMDFRITDRDVWYVIKYCETDPDCLGLNFLTRRKLGKTAISGCWAYDRTSKRPKNQHCGIQSKDDKGAEEVMKKAIIQPWKKLPEFFRPVYDLMKGDTPTELRLFNTSRRGSTAESELEEEEALDSWIDYGPATEGFYDGPELDTYISDEAGKVEKKINIRTRQDIVRYCSEIEGIMKGKQLYTTTVEADETTADEHIFQQLVYDSNPLIRNKNNRTLTGLYTFFLPAHKAFRFDNYGYNDDEFSYNSLMNTREALLEQGKLRELASAKRKNPMTLQEAFSVDGENSVYNPILLEEQIGKIMMNERVTERGDLVWEDGYEFEKPVKNEQGEERWEINGLLWQPNPKGRFEKLKGWWPKNPNNVIKRNGFYIPNGDLYNAIGCDPFKYDKTKDKRRSNCAAFNYQIGDELFPDEYDNMFTIRYSERPESTREANYDILKMSWLCGCKVLFERNVNHWKNDFKDWNCGGFLSYMKGEEEPGIVTDGAGKVVQAICNYSEAYINSSVSKVYFISLLNKETGWLGFKVDDTQKYDEPMAAGFTLIAVKGKMNNKKYKTKPIDLESFLPMRKAI